ncbi:DUF3224 domain-containing protein [Actinospica robiniae]|uniref:DUF3224 domain-containing protein n=1 Tax=Actinospica robiniae TaxID=304901 RepID=UPI001FDED9B8|nr:DUF3224 domain-containing protein [Actinospica robiniae]
MVAFTSASIAPDAAASIEKHYEGDIAGHSATLFATSHDQCDDVSSCRGVEECTCVALESFEGTVSGRNGAFDFAHSPATADANTTCADKIFRIVPASGTGLLTGIHGTGGMAIDADGTHRIWFDYELG